MKRWVDHIVCALPFEPEWYRARGISPQYFGHPYFDELARQRLNDSFQNEQRSRGKAIVAVLPGSRNQEVKANWPSFRQAIELIHARLPDARFLIAAYSESHRRQIADSLRSSDLPVETHVGRTKEIIALGDACMAVSGSVGLELLHGLLPSVVVYRTRWIDVPFLRVMMKVPYFSIVNLLAGEEVFPEFTAPRCPAAAIADRITGWLERPGELEHIRDRLRRIKEQVHRTGACKRAAEFILATHRVRQADAAGSVTEAQGKENVHILNRAILHQQQSAPVVTPLGADARE
jgi:lipid-A-disaccharide synthase